MQTLRHLLCALAGALLVLSLHAAETAKSYNLPTGDAALMLRQFAEVSGRETLFSAETVRGIRTAPVKGEFTPQEALDQMLANTGLVAILDAKAGAFAVRKETSDEKNVAGRPTDRQTAADKAADNEEKVIELDRFIVTTGVFQGLKKSEATVALSTITKEDLAKTVPASAASLLENVSGVYVNSALGEIRNIVYSRGVSANAADGASGYFYVSMQEDGLPVTNVTAGNYGPDYFLRADAMLERVEAVRGGSAAVTNSNAPGGIFNYITKTGTDVAGGVVSARFGLEGGGENPFYRTDLAVSGPLGKGWYYSAGGFYRHSVGARDAGYPLNQGGQIKANLVKKFENGSVQIYAKMLDDRNGWAEFIPAVNFNDPRPARGFDNKSSVLPPKVSFRFPTGPNSSDTYDSSDLVHSKSKYAGVKLDFTFGDGWWISNNLRYTDNDSRWNTGALIFPLSLTDFFTFLLTSVPAGNGTLTFRDKATNTSAVVTRVGGTGTIVSNSLPGSLDVPNAAILQSGFIRNPHAKEWTEQLTVSKKADRMIFTGGVFYSHTDMLVSQRSSGFGMSTVTPNPRMLDLTWVPAGTTTVQQVTNAQGFGAPRSTFVNHNDATWRQLGLFFGHRWEIADIWAFDWGVRHDRVKVETANMIAGSAVTTVSTSGGVDGNPNTIFDNQFVPFGPLLNVQRDVNSTSYSAAISRKIGKHSSTYLRYSLGKKAPDLSFAFNLNNPLTNSLNPSIPQEVEQWELGYKLGKAGFSLAVTPFHSQLTNVASIALLTNIDGSLYNRILLNSTETSGVEVEGEYHWQNGVGIRGAFTWQRGKATKWGSWVGNAPGPADDTLIDYSGNKADNNPDIMATITPSWRKGKFYGQLQWKYMGERPANVPNALFLPAFHQTDVMAKWDFTDRLSLGFNVNNVFDDFGVMSFAAPGAFFARLNRQGFTPAARAANPNADFSIATIPSRAFFTTLTYKF